MRERATAAAAFFSQRAEGHHIKKTSARTFEGPLLGEAGPLARVERGQLSALETLAGQSSRSPSYRARREATDKTIARPLVSSALCRVPLERMKGQRKRVRVLFAFHGQQRKKRRKQARLASCRSPIDDNSENGLHIREKETTSVLHAFLCCSYKCSAPTKSFLSKTGNSDRLLTSAQDTGFSPKARVSG